MAAAAPAFTYRHSGQRSALFLAADAVLVAGDWMVFTDSSLNRWEVYVDGVHQRTFVNADTWESFDGPAEVSFEADFIDAYRHRAVREMRFITTETGPYAAAARQQAANKGTNTIRAKDRITDLSERAEGLVLQAASLNRTPSELELQIFAVRHASLVQDMVALENDLARLRSKIDTAGVALVGMSS